MSADACVLRAEHELAGATFADDGLAVPVLAYAGAKPAKGGVAAGGLAGLCDLSGLFVELIEGDGADAFAEAACAGPRLNVAGASFGAVLTGEGGVVAVPLLTRTGAAEYVALDATARAEVLGAWLSFLSTVEQGGVAPYRSVRLTNASAVHVPLLLVGEAATAVLGDYVGGPAQLPGPGVVAELALDGRIGCLCLGLPFTRPCMVGYLLLVSPRHARVLWRSLLSFRGVVPLGRTALLDELAGALPWLAQVAAARDRLTISHRDLRRWGLVREGGGYVGARGLAAMPATDG